MDCAQKKKKKKNDAKVSKMGDFQSVAGLMGKKGGMYDE